MTVPPEVDALREFIEALLPEHFANIDRQDRWRPLTSPEPCERCGTVVVLVEWLVEAPGLRRWCEVTLAGLRRRMKGERTALELHGDRRCDAARAALSEPRQMDLDDLISDTARRSQR